MTNPMDRDLRGERLRGRRPIVRLFLRGEYSMELPSDVDLEDEIAVRAAVESIVAEVEPAELGSAVEIANYEVGAVDGGGQFNLEPR